MPKKKANPSTRPTQFSFRSSSDEVAKSYENCAVLEGFGSVAQWLQSLANARVDEMKRHMDEGSFVRIGDRTYPAAEVPGMSEIEAILQNITRFCLLGDTNGFLQASKWISKAKVRALSKEQAARLRRLEDTLPQDLSTQLPCEDDD